MKAAHELDAGDLLMGKFCVEKRLGAGAMGIVYAARHVELGHRVAIKVLRAQVAQSDQKVRFLREARASVSLKSEHVARVLDVGTTDDGAPYMVMEHLDGRDLADELRARGPLPIDEAVEYVMQVCEAVAEAHAAGIVHRDIKPANLFLTTGTGGLPRVKVLDFGISKVSDNVGLTGNMALGSPLYMAPEHMRASAQVDARADIWALGVTLYELIAGKPPFYGDNIQTVCALVFNEPPKPLGTYRPDAPQGFEAILGHCLEKDRTRRFPSAAALAAALAPYAPPRARMYAERAALALGEQVSMSRPTDVLPPAPAAPAPVATGAGRTSISSPAFTHTPPSGSPAMTGAPTVSAARAELPQKKSRLWIAALAALVLGGGAAAALFGLLPRDQVGSVPAGSAATTPSAITSNAPAPPEPATTADAGPVVEPSATASAAPPPAVSAPPKVTPLAPRPPPQPAPGPNQPKSRRNIYDQ